jgi:Tfp pilus assembly protein PilX
MVIKTINKLKDQSGAALVVALIMIIVLTLIGLASTFTSTFEIKLSGNKRASTDAFFATDAGLQSVRANQANFTMGNFTEAPGALSVDLQQEPIDKKFSQPLMTLPAGVNFNDQPQVVIYHLRYGGEGTQGGSITNTYLIDSIGKDQIGMELIRSKSQVREKWTFREIQEGSE